jgi:outer membrane lipoprotein-sorting protein
MGRYLFGFITYLLLGMGLSSPLASLRDTAHPNEILRKAESIRMPSGSVLLDIKVTEFSGKVPKAESSYRAYLRDSDHVLVEFVSPPSAKGKGLLLLGEHVWAFVPFYGKAIRVPLKQRLLGEVSVVDVMRSNYSRDYQAQLEGETISGNKPAYVLLLQAKNPDKVYPKIKYLVSKKDFNPLSLEVFSGDGNSLRTLTFQEYQKVEGVSRPTLWIFQDSKKNQEITHLKFTKMERKIFEDMTFTKQFMQTLQ